MLVNRLLNLRGHEQPVQVIPGAEVHREAFRRRLGALIDHAVGKYHDTDVGFLCPLPLPVFLDEDKGPDQQDGYSIAMPTLFFLRHQNRRSAHLVTHAGDDHRRRQAVAACHIIQEPTTEVAVAHIRPQ
jgi:hypothetical protein